MGLVNAGQPHLKTPILPYEYVPGVPLTPFRSPAATAPNRREPQYPDQPVLTPLEGAFRAATERYEQLA